MDRAHLTISPENEAVLRRADRESETVAVTFRDGTRLIARIREMDLELHHTLTLLDMDGACCARIVELKHIATVERADAQDASSPVCPPAASITHHDK